VLQQLVDRGHALRLDRRPGQKEERFAHLMGDVRAAPPEAPSPPAGPTADGDLATRVAALETAVADLRSELAALRGGRASD
jgi:uncharacterized protein YceH (UPF0502 family)